jgi:hypothetical protein
MPLTIGPAENSYKTERTVSMRHLLKLLIMLAILACTFPSAALGQAYSGVISVDAVEAVPGEQIGVPVRLSNNDVPLSGLTVPLKFSSSDLIVDSVSFAGSILSSDFDDNVVVDNVSHEIIISYLPDFMQPIPIITTAAGLIGTIFLSIAPGATPGTMISIDSINIDTVASDGGPATHIWEKVHASDQSGTVILLPDYEPGGVVVKSPTGIDDGIEPSGLPTSFSLSQNYPNPFNPTTAIEFGLPCAGLVKLEVFNILGQKVLTLIDRRLPAGNHQVEFDATNFPSGVYFYRLSHDEVKLTRKMTLVK